MTLLGIGYFPARPHESWAIINDRLYRPGDAVMDLDAPMTDLHVTRIHPRAVEFDLRGGKLVRELRSDEPPAPGQRLGAPTVEADPAGGVRAGSGLQEGGPAQVAGLRPDDAIVRVGDTAVATPDDLARALAACELTAPVAIVVRRAGIELRVAVKLQGP